MASACNPRWGHFFAMEALILVATSGGPTMFARIGVMRALNRHVERVFNPDRMDHHWGAVSWRGIDDPGCGPTPSMLMGSPGLATRA